MSARKIGLTAVLLFAFGPSYACFPVATAVDGKATAVQQTAEQRLLETLKNKRDLALVTVESETFEEEHPASAFAILKIRHGWGQAKKRLLTYPREEAKCGPLQQLKKGEDYLVVLERHKVVDIFEYSMARKPLKALGDPQYKYTRKGVLKISSD